MLKTVSKKTKSSMMAQKYFYGVINKKITKSYGNCGIFNKQVYSIPYKDISIIVSDAPSLQIDLNEENILTHNKVLSLIMEEYTIIPSEFGTVIGDEKIIKQLMRKCYEAIKTIFKIINNTFELGVKIITVNNNVEIDDKKIENIVNELKSISDQVIFGDQFSDRLVLNTSFLVNKNDYDRFSDKIDELVKASPELKILYSGPWAPYNFVHLNIGKNGIYLYATGR